MTKIREKRDCLDPREERRCFEPLFSSEPAVREKVAEIQWEKYKYVMPITRNRVKYVSVKEQVEQRIRHSQQLIAKMVQLQEEAMDKLIRDREDHEKGMPVPDASSEDFCSRYKALAISS